MALFPPYNGSPLMDQICSVENVTLAWRRVRSNIQLARRGVSAGSDAITLRDFEADWTRHMTQLTDELQYGTYRPLPVRSVQLPKVSGGTRAIAILAVRDRIAQRATQQVLEPLFEPYFLDCSYGCRPRVGVPEAIARVQRYAASGLSWVVDADVASYFDSIDHQLLMRVLRQRITDVRVLQLIAQWLAVGVLTTPQAPVLPPTTPLQRGAAALRRAVQWGIDAPSALSVPTTDPYAGGGWDTAGSTDPYAYLAPRRTMPQTVWDAALLAQPVLHGARAALPYVQRIGGRRLALAGAVAAGAIAVTEIAAHQRPSQRGTLQGGALSPLLANIYLHAFDVALTSQGLRLVRFVDDFVVLCASEQEATQALTLAQRQLAVLRLSVNAEKTQIVPYADGMTFLGTALTPPRPGKRLGSDVRSFAEAEALLRETSSRVQGAVRRRSHTPSKKGKKV